MSHVTIDGRDFELDKQSGPARQQAMNINLVDQEIRRLQVQLAICQTARNAYATALQSALPKDQSGTELRTPVFTMEDVTAAAAVFRSISKLCDQCGQPSSRALDQAASFKCFVRPVAGESGPENAAEDFDWQDTDCVMLPQQQAAALYFNRAESADGLTTTS